MDLAASKGEVSKAHRSVTTLRHNPEDHDMDFHRREKLTILNADSLLLSGQNCNATEM